MILVDTSVWIDHFRQHDMVLVKLLGSQQVLIHPFVIGELAVGNLRQRNAILGALQDLPMANVASDDEVLSLIDRQALFGLGLGYIDVHLLAAARWTYDKRLLIAANHMSLGINWN